MKSDTAIIIPTYKRPHILKEHLKELTKQTTKDFDVVIVYGNEDDILNDEFGLSATHIKRKEDIGSAGGFYLGEKFCIEEGYKQIILADDDCYPVSKNLIESVVKGLKNGAALVFPKIKTNESGDGKPNCIIAQYGGLKADVLKIIGLTYLPFYQSGEDIELYQRILKRKMKILFIDCVAFHSHLPFFLTLNPVMSFYYHRNSLIANFLRNRLLKLIFIAIIFLWSGLAILFVNKKLSRSVILGSVNALTLNFDVNQVIFDLETDTKDAIETPDEVHIRIKDWEDTPETTSNYFGLILGMICEVISNLPGRILSYFGRNIVIEGRFGIGEIPLILIARSAVWKSKNRNVILNGGSIYWLSPIYAVILLVALPAIVAAVCFIVLYGVLKKSLLGISSDGYGLSD